MNKTGKWLLLVLLVLLMLLIVVDCCACSSLGGNAIVVIGALLRSPRKDEICTASCRSNRSGDTAESKKERRMECVVCRFPMEMQTRMGGGKLVLVDEWT